MAGAIALQLLLTTSAAALSGPSKRAALGAALLSLGTPFLAPAEPALVRVLLALASAMTVVRAIDLVRDERRWPLGRRLLLFFVAFDSREADPIDPRIDLRGFGTGLLYLAASAAGLWLACAAPAVAGGPGLVLRWLGGVVFVYCGADGLNGLMTAACLARGLRIPVQHRAPILSRSVREFWSERWNRNVHAWLTRHCYRPLARRGLRVAGIAAAFAASALVHAWLVAVVLDLTLVLMMGGFFLLQGAVVALESRLPIRRWPRAARHAWAALWLLGPSPLFVEPFLRAVAT